MSDNPARRLRTSLVGAARALELDLVAGQVIGVFARARISNILLRGPSISRWLYADGPEARSYVDIDLLVPPESMVAAASALSGLGFAYVLMGGQHREERPIHAWTWHRASDAAVVDLHHTIIGAQASGERVWEVMSGEREPISVAGVAINGLSAQATALVVALHAAQHGKVKQKPIEDLNRALDRLPGSTWERAASLADSIDARVAFVTGLRLLPAGNILADGLGLPILLSAETLLRAGGAPPTALGFEWLTHVPGARSKAGLLAAKIFPDRAFMRWWSPLAAKGRLGLASAYAWRVIWLGLNAPRGFVAWARATRAASAERTRS